MVARSRVAKGPREGNLDWRNGKEPRGSCADRRDRHALGKVSIEDTRSVFCVSFLVWQYLFF